PEAAASYLLRNDGDTFSVAQSFPDFGLVSGAVFTDFDGDGSPDLALACEWSSIRLFHNERGKLTPWNAPVTIDHASRRSSTKADQPPVAPKLDEGGLVAPKLD